jgi:phenylacetate-coenzyme A ligase PaaK-like adenylate-forming protein
MVVEVASHDAAAKLLLTNVANYVLPLIRYEVTDETTFVATPNPDPWTGRRISAVAGCRGPRRWGPASSASARK